MPLNDKKLKRLDQLLSAFDNGAVQPDELIKAIDAVMSIVDSNAKSLADALNDSQTETDASLKALKSQLTDTKSTLQATIADIKAGSDTSVANVRQALLKELKRIEAAIPVLPPETDLTEIFTEFERQRTEIGKLATLIVGENIRNALESLTGEDRLDISAIKGLEDYNDIKQRKEASHVTGVRLLRYLSDVDIQGITNGQTLAWNATLNRFRPATPSGSGDMTAAVYDPQAIAGDAFDTDNHTDGTTNKVYTATEKTKLAGIEAGADVTDTTNVTAAGALMDSEVANLAAVKAFNPADYASALGADDNYVTDAEKIVIGNTSGTNTGDEPNASTTVAGVVELAIASEVNTGTDDTRAITPDALAGSNFGVRVISILLNDSTALTTGDGKAYIRIPNECNGMDLVGVRASRVAGTGVPLIQIHNVTAAVDMLSTRVSIDSGETDSSSAATPAVINTSNDSVATAQRLRIDVDDAGTGSTWVEVQLAFRLS